MRKELESRFGVENVSLYKIINDELEILRIHVPLLSPVTVLVTNGLSSYKMPVHEMYKGREYSELFFCLPAYWDVNELDNPNRQWPVVWLEKLVNHVKNKKGWFGPGHSILCYPDYRPISETMKQNHLLLVDPMFLEKEMRPLAVADKTIYFLAGLPMFGEEMDFKQGKGTYKLLKKLKNDKITEKLDDFRESVLASRWKIATLFQKGNS